jgi:hypothetical protein
MRAYHFDHVDLRSRDPDAMGSWFETLFGAVVSRRPDAGRAEVPVLRHGALRLHRR